MEQSILKSTKKVLHIGPDDESFDLDIMTHINAAFSTLFDVGVGEPGFAIEDDTAEWTDFIEDDLVQLNKAKQFVLLSVRLIFDPPQTTFVLGALEKQKDELLWRINVHREYTEWVDPDPTLPSEFAGDLDGGAA